MKALNLIELNQSDLINVAGGLGSTTPLPPQPKLMNYIESDTPNLQI